MKRIHGRASRVGYRRLRVGRSAPESTGAGEAKVAPGLGRGWFLRQRDDLLRDTLVAVVCGALLLAAAIWFDDRRQLKAEVLENTRFVRQSVMDPTVKLKPFIGLNLHGASLASLPLGCPKDAAPRDCADFRRADLSSANLIDAGLTGADLAGADLAGADLTGADLTGADLTGADLTGADLIDADLTGAD